MKILGLTPNNPMTGETPEQMYLRKLKDLGHEIIITEQLDNLENLDIDVIVSLSEATCEHAAKVAKVLNKPFYAHMEWLPRWRIGRDEPCEWGYENMPFIEKMGWIRTYQRFVFFWGQANVKSLAGDCFKQDMKDFVGADLIIETKILGVDEDRINEYKNGIRQDKHNEVTCIARFVPHKRLIDVIYALQFINFKGVLNLVGYGPEYEKYIQAAAMTGIEIAFWESEDKLVALDRSKCCVSFWSGLVPMEAMMLGVPCVSTPSDYMLELYGDTLLYGEQLSDIAEQIKICLEMEDIDRKLICDYGINAMHQKSISTYTQEEAVKQLESLIKLAIEKWKKTQNQDSSE